MLVAKLAGISKITDIGLTTNGILLAEQAQQLFDAGLRRINISLDALDPLKFREITRRDGYEKVIHSIQVAQRVGFDPVKVNAVSVRGMTEEEIVPVRSLCPRDRRRSQIHRIHATGCRQILGTREGPVCS